MNCGPKIDCCLTDLQVRAVGSTRPQYDGGPRDGSRHSGGVAEASTHHSELAARSPYARRAPARAASPPASCSARKL
jgi:hypothetical protein